MVPGSNYRNVVRHISDNSKTAGGGYVVDDLGQVWRVLDPWESCCNTGSTTGTMCGELYGNTIKPKP